MESEQNETPEHGQENQNEVAASMPENYSEVAVPMPEHQSEVAPPMPEDHSEFEASVPEHQSEFATGMSEHQSEVAALMPGHQSEVATSRPESESEVTASMPVHQSETSVSMPEYQSEVTVSGPHTPNPSEQPVTFDGPPEDYTRPDGAVQPEDDTTAPTKEKPQPSSSKSDKFTWSRAQLTKAPSSIPNGDPRRPRVEQIRMAEVIYHERKSVIQKPLVPPRLCRELPKPWKPLPGNCLCIRPGPDRNWLVQEKQHFQQLRSQGSSVKRFDLNPAALTPLTARPNPHTRATPKNANGCLEMGWKEREERLKDYRDHVLAERIGYETLVGNLLYIDIPKGRDINRSWENFLSDDVMEWGFPYYKGSRDRPRVRQREPYLAHQLREKLWKYPKTRIFHSVAED